MTAIVGGLPRSVPIPHYGEVPVRAVVHAVTAELEDKGFRRYGDAVVQVVPPRHPVSALNFRRMIRVRAGNVMIAMSKTLPAIQRANLQATARALAAPEAGSVVRYMATETRLRLPVASEAEVAELGAHLTVTRAARADAEQALPGVLAMFEEGPVPLLKVANAFQMVAPVLADAWPHAACAGRGVLGDLLTAHYEVIGEGARRMVVVPPVTEREVT